MNSQINTSYLTSAYLPPLDYFRVIGKSENVLIENCENYQKQSYRSRCHIYSDSGLMPLIVPVVRQPDHSAKISDVRIDYSKDWQKQHWRAIVSAYKSSPYFDYYQDDISPFYFNREESLFNFNYKLLMILTDLIGIDANIGVTKEYCQNYGETDYRESIHPKRKCLQDINENGRYHQVFAHKHGFIPNLSIIDLLFNEGPNSLSYL